MNKDFGLLLARVALGASIASHGAQKRFGWFEGPGPDGAAAFFEQLGFIPGSPYADAAAKSELAAGVAIAAGALGPVGPATVISTMIVAARAAHWKNGFFAAKGGIEVAFLYGVAAALLAFSGPGRYSLDGLLRLRWFEKPARTWWALAGCSAVAELILASRQTPPPATRPEPAAE